MLTLISNTDKTLRPIYDTPRMSQLLTEALQDVLWAEEQLEAAAAAVLARNGTHARIGAPAGPAKLPPSLGQPKLWWLPHQKKTCA